MSNSLSNFQAAVGGYIETVTICEDVVIICNEEGRLRGLPHNCEICGVDFVGDIVIAGVKGEEFADLPISYQEAKSVFRSLWDARGMTIAEALAMEDKITYCLPNSTMKEAVRLVFDALRELETPMPKTICGITGTPCVDCKGGACEARRIGVPSDA